MELTENGRIYFFCVRRFLISNFRTPFHADININRSWSHSYQQIFTAYISMICRLTHTSLSITNFNRGLLNIIEQIAINNGYHNCLPRNLCNLISANLHYFPKKLFVTKLLTTSKTDEKIETFLKKFDINISLITSFSIKKNMTSNKTKIDANKNQMYTWLILCNKLQRVNSNHSFSLLFLYHFLNSPNSNASSMHRTTTFSFR